MKEKCEKIVKILTEQNKTIAFMESCTGGFLANQITNISGASNVLKVSLVTYSNEYEIKLGVDKKIIDEYTVYSQETAKSMAKAVAEFAQSNIGIGVTGELGNISKNENKVYYAIYNKDKDEYNNKEVIIDQNERRKMKEQVAYIIFTDILGGIEWKIVN